ncbi:prolyl oligopeptidase family serine peptidase [Pedobacter sp.]|uniref:S9 family peptidase n=1 Tax=Pedobacter sp. TaxID=1411316 RepID=UPI0031D40838
MQIKRISAIMAICLLGCISVIAQQADYLAAQKYDAPNLAKRVGTLKIIPFFLKNSHKFWFVANGSAPLSNQLNQGNGAISGSLLTNVHYIVDMASGRRQELFDKAIIIDQLKGLTQGEVNSAQVIYTPEFSADEKSVLVSYAGRSYDYHYEQKQLIKRQIGLQQKKSYQKIGVSSDNKWELYTRAHNLYISANNNHNDEHQLSTDAEPYYSFCVDEKGDYKIDKTYPSVAKWINGRYFYALRIDKRKVQTMSIIQSGFTPRPLIYTYKYELPGDQYVAQYELYIGDALKGNMKKVDLQHWPDQQLEVVSAPDDPQEIFVLRRKRTRDEIELCAVNLETGKVRVVINEVSKPFINEDFFDVSIIKKGTEILWWSDRSGWGQYYRYSDSGKLINRMGKDNYTAGKILAIDTAKGYAYLNAFGKEAHTNPYYAKLYKVSFDGKSEQLLTPENATHQVYISPDRRYFIDNYSRIDLEPVTMLRKIDGKPVAQIFKPDLDSLNAYGWKHPEPFIVKAKDHVTDLYGLIWKPFNFDPNKKYPVISQVYPGPQIETVWPDFTVLDKYNNAALAQLGFIVISVGHRGGSPIRDAHYYKFGYGNLRDNGIDDDKYAIEQLAGRFSYLDLDRVGIFGHSGGGMMTIAAMCKYPDFYKVGVASSGNHDNRIYLRAWGESYQGLENKMPVNEDLASKLQGHLMLVTGEVDDNVNPANTYRMVDALIKADKNFDLLLLPGQNHHYEGAAKLYFEKRMRAFFAKYFIEQDISHDKK